MTTPSFAMKVYDYQWATTHGMEPSRAADELARDGVDTVLVRNQIDPLPTSGVDQDAYLAAASLGRDIDQRWSTALREAGRVVYQTTALFFEPSALATFPDARPISADGRPERGFDWYRGICPTHEGFLQAKVERLRRVTAELEPDGLFLSFTRFPGFWENWVPEYRFTDADRFCFCDRCRNAFAAAHDLDLPAGETASQARWILDHHGAEWDAWRAARVGEAISRIAAAARQVRPDLTIMLNTLPFPRSEFAGSDVRRAIAAQDLAVLRGVVDRFELMTYLQILDRPDAWLAPVVADARHDVPDRPLLCTLQVAPLYTTGVHAGRGRATEISAESLAGSARAALAAGADGLVFYHWTDFLEDEAAGGRKREVLREVARG
ncbi:MAG: hypothetical protein U0031_02475 [Thermomicrobiales bacterium]